MCLEQLLSILEYKSLYFPLVSELMDKWEGYLPKAAIEIVRSKLPSTIDDSEKTWLVPFMQNQSRRDMRVNCWHMNSDESAAMWSVYAPEKGIAIRSTVQRLERCFDDLTFEIRIAKLRYLSAEEYVVEAAPGHVFIKRKSYEHEREIRALVFSPDGHFAIQPEILIEHLLISPDAPSWMVSVIQNAVNKRYSFNIDVKQSTLNTLT
jgi:hypothetical protein